MKKITEKLRRKAQEDSRPLIEQLVREGVDTGTVVQTYKRLVESRINAYYAKLKLLSPINNGLGELINGLNGDVSADSKAEVIFYNILKENQVDFKFHYSIGPYTADYFIPDDLVVELDGPMHDKDRDKRRDRYMRNLGYRVLRLPIWIVANDPQAVVNEIKAA